ncbi:MAG: hypothetical protein LBG64_04410 [Pseudomonadales bacterium]|jgi:hypothetical protein|nr:hypothetical protein [Pseudomonadales bacterium]
MASDRDKMLACVDKDCQPIGESVNRNYHYGNLGKADTWVCGIMYFIIDNEGRVLLIERTSEKEHTPGRISAPSRHLYPEQETYVEGLANEIGVAYSRTNFVSFVQVDVICTILPKRMLVRYCVLQITDECKSQIKINENEACAHRFEPWQTARKAFLLSSDTNGAYAFHGNDKREAVIEELDRHVAKILEN